MIYVIASSIARPLYLNDYRASLLGLVAPTRKEPGCLLYDLHCNRDNPTHFIFYEIWDSQAALDSHSESRHLTDHLERSKDWVASSELHLLKRIA
ncbi:MULTISPECIES: putative quinol monooxygenase [unclassified Halomonas]|uniref:putative quinol monooxygenase n=1 Tax=unclassified Halomonas TaxID=2609666 RepID=UPI00257F9F59|nr:putative quinol monooxygenase [Halomonas sp.]MCJ8284441.1 antibiotic biosynthesis monooxygenase [Halomonas sp.]NQY69495.1 antibiotic biosynthesis monooxygenase [Halomonas sp.]